jgi:hypothetical protein
MAARMRSAASASGCDTSDCWYGEEVPAQTSNMVNVDALTADANGSQASSQAQSQTGTVTILGQTVPYTIAAMSAQASTAALTTLNKVVANINDKQSQLTPAQITEIQAVKSIYIKSTISLIGAVGFSVTNSQLQHWTSVHENISVPVGTFVISAAKMSLVSTGYLASGFVHEGVHMMHQDFGHRPPSAGLFSNNIGRCHLFT